MKLDYFNEIFKNYSPFLHKLDKRWIQKAYASGDVKEDKLTKWCDGNVTCECVERALENKGMKKGAQMYLNMNKSKCKSLRDD